MNRRLIRIVAAVATAGVVSVSGATLASAASDPTARAQAATVSAKTTTHDAAKYLRYLHDELDSAAHAGDVHAAYDTVTKLRPVLKVVQQAPVERASLDLSSRADTQAAELERGLPGLDLLGPVSALVSSLLSTVMDLVTSLLGGLPVPLPDLPLPDLPELPDLPVPGAPPEDAPAPPEDAPAPPEDAPVPDLPVPDLPDAPLPDAPLP